LIFQLIHFVVMIAQAYALNVAASGPSYQQITLMRLLMPDGRA
jgi:hypothetical protein